MPRYWLWVTPYATGVRTLITFWEADERNYAAISLSSQPVDLRLEDR